MSETRTAAVRGDASRRRVRRAVANGLAWAWGKVTDEKPPEIEPVMLKHMRVEPNGEVDIALTHSVVKMLAGHMATWFDTMKPWREH